MANGYGGKGIVEIDISIAINIPYMASLTVRNKIWRNAEGKLGRTFAEGLRTSGDMPLARCKSSSECLYLSLISEVTSALPGLLPVRPLNLHFVCILHYRRQVQVFLV